jgi:hypothetical protein
VRGPGLDEGWFVVQDEASQLVHADAGEHPPPASARHLRVARRQNLGAGRGDGGRGCSSPATCAIGASILLRRTVAASGAANVRIVQADLLKPLPFASPFDCVLVDAPCSGLGTLRRDPDIRWRRREGDLARSPPRADDAAARRGDGRGGRPADLRDLLERARGERRGRRRLLATTPASPCTRRRPPELADDARSTARAPADAAAPHGLEAFFGAVFERRCEAAARTQPGVSSVFACSAVTL